MSQSVEQDFSNKSVFRGFDSFFVVNNDEFIQTFIETSIIIQFRENQSDHLHQKPPLGHQTILEERTNTSQRESEFSLVKTIILWMNVVETVVEGIEEPHHRTVVLKALGALQTLELLRGVLENEVPGLLGELDVFVGDLLIGVPNRKQQRQQFLLQ